MMTEKDEKDLLICIGQIRRAMVLIRRSIQRGEPLGRGALDFTRATTQQLVEIECRILGKLRLPTENEKHAKQTGAVWPDTADEVWNARK